MPSANPQTPAASPDIVDVALQNFRADVMDESLKRLVLIDFWAPWHQPCKDFTPILEKIVASRRGAVRLARLNVDDNPEIVGRMGIQSIPAVAAFLNGQMVDAFAGALPESEVKAFVERILGPEPEDPDAVYAQAREAEDKGAADEAMALFVKTLDLAPDHVGARAGLAKIAIAHDDLDQGAALLEAIPAKDANHPEVAAARAALALKRQAGALGDLTTLVARVDNAPTDWQARHDLAMALNGAGRRDAAAEHLLNIIKHDRKWNDEAARKLLLQFFDSWGPADPATRSARRRLSALLFS